MDEIKKIMGSNIEETSPEFPYFNIYPYLSVEENLHFYATLKGSFLSYYFILIR
jgi:ABC-type multidrug transport system ATPase subunit